MNTTARLYTETFNTFKEPKYPGQVKSVTILPRHDNVWVAIYQDGCYNGFYVQSEGYSSPYAMVESFNPELLAVIEYPASEIYCLLVNRKYRHYFVVVDYIDLICSVKPWGYCYQKIVDKNLFPARCQRFMRLLNKHYRKLSYGHREILLVGAGCLEMTYHGTVINRRAGVIPYDIIDGSVSLALGVTVTGAYRDFGGSCSWKNRETSLSCIRKHIIEQAGRYNGKLMVNSIQDNNGTVVYQARNGKDRNIIHVALTRVPFSKFQPSKDMVFVSVSELNKLGPEMIHPPILEFIRRVNTIVDYLKMTPMSKFSYHPCFNTQVPVSKVMTTHPKGSRMTRI